MCYHLMMFFWRLSEKHWLLKPFEMIGDFLEDLGLDKGWITLSPQCIQAIEEGMREIADGRYTVIGSGEELEEFINGLTEEKKDTKDTLIRAALTVYEANISVGYEHPKMEEWAASLRQLDRAAEKYLEGEK